MTAVNETALVQEITKAVKKAHPRALVWKIHGGPMQMVGIPDLLMSIDGMFIGAEVKHQKPGETQAHARRRATEVQLIRIEEINESGGLARVVLSSDETLQLIKDALKLKALADSLARSTQNHSIEATHIHQNGLTA